MGQQGFRTINANPFVYQEIDSGVSIAYGVDSTVNKIKIKAQLTVGATPTGTAQIMIDPAAAGNITFTPNGAGKVVVASGGFTVTAGATTITPLTAARPSTVRCSPSGVLSNLIDSNVDGQFLISSNAGQPIWASLTAGPNIILTPGHNSLTIASGATTLMPWTPVPGNAVNLAPDNGYILNNVGLTTATLPLPPTCPVGAIIRVYGATAGLFRIAQNAGQSIRLGAASTTPGIAGFLQSTQQNDSIELLCVVADTVFAAISSVGNFNLS